MFAMKPGGKRGKEGSFLFTICEKYRNFSSASQLHIAEMKFKRENCEKRENFEICEQKTQETIFLRPGLRQMTIYISWVSENYSATRISSQFRAKLKFCSFDEDPVSLIKVNAMGYGWGGRSEGVMTDGFRQLRNRLSRDSTKSPSIWDAEDDPLDL